MNSRPNNAQARATSGILTGFMIAPLFSAAATALVVIILSGDLTAGFIVAGGLIIAGYTASLLVGLPLFVVWRRMGWLGFKAMCALGCSSAFLLTVGLSLLIGSSRTHTPWLIGLANLLMFSLPIGLVAGAALWWVGVRGSNTLAKTAAPAIRRT